MKKFLRNHINTVIAISALLFCSLIVGYYIWGIGYIIKVAREANDSRTTEAKTSGFDLQGASGLDYRGIGVSTSGKP